LLIFEPQANCDGQIRELTKGVSVGQTSASPSLVLGKAQKMPDVVNEELRRVYLA